MSLVKPPPRKPKTASLQVRIDTDIRQKLDLYAEFIESSPSYVVAEALKLLFNEFSTEIELLPYILIDPHLQSRRLGFSRWWFNERQRLSSFRHAILPARLHALHAAL